MLWSVECEVKSVKSVKTVKTVKTVIWSVESGVCSVWSMDCAIGVAECEVEWRVWMWSVECGMKAVKCEAFSVKWRVESVRHGVCNEATIMAFGCFRSMWMFLEIDRPASQPLSKD